MLDYLRSPWPQLTPPPRSLLQREAKPGPFPGTPSCLVPGQSLQMRGTPKIRKKKKKRPFFFRYSCSQTCGELRIRMSSCSALENHPFAAAEKAGGSLLDALDSATSRVHLLERCRLSSFLASASLPFTLLGLPTIHYTPNSLN